jgi:CheY-like chemotaxis protein/anti-sigma regulatory factor (Ser/Thr protein kinase)
MREIVRSLRTFSHPNDGEREAVDVRGAMRSALQLAAGTLRPRVRVVESYEDGLFVKANESQLVQVFLNLVVNAAQATQEGTLEPVIFVSVESDHERVIVAVRDEGIGMSAEQQARIFEPFFTTKKRGEGTGLGLSICLGIVTSLSGEITVESHPGRGSIFRVMLPAHRPERPISTANAAPLGGALTTGRRRILVVDDEPMIGTMIEQLFGDDLEVSKEEQASRALSRLQRGERFDVILCDLMMPTMSGPDLHAELLKLAPDQAERMVFITGGAFTASARQFLARVSNARIDKPFDLDRLSMLLKGGAAAQRTA